ncbi:hypothetical protein BDB13_6432 [Rhodococcus sp. OK302]|nr:hypothetical protein BDB13_6432 [Rhodococcus sp. OK302]
MATYRRASPDRRCVHDAVSRPVQGPDRGIAPAIPRQLPRLPAMQPPDCDRIPRALQDALSPLDHRNKGSKAIHVFSPTISGSGMGRWRGCGGSMRSSRGDRRRSSPPLPRNWSRRSPTLLACTLNPPEKAIVLCMDEKSQIRPSTGQLPRCRCRSGFPSDRPRTTTLYAALGVATGKGTGICRIRQSPGVSGVSETRCSGRSRSGSASGDGQPAAGHSGGQVAHTMC